MPQVTSNTIEMSSQLKKQIKKQVVSKVAKKVVRSLKPKTVKLRGKGGYWEDIGDILANGSKDLLKAGLTRLTEFALTGGGRYNIKRNSILRQAAVNLRGKGTYVSNSDSGFETNSAPMFTNNMAAGSDIVICHREYVQDITSSTTFTPLTFPINPGNPNLFPWLSQFADLYEEYSFEGLVFEYKSLSASAVGTTSSAMGAVIMATDYDCEDDNYANKRQMEDEEYAVSGMPFQTFIHPVECDPKRNVLAKLYTEPGITVSTQAPGDPRFCVLGNFTIATSGQQASGQIIGELWVSYHIRLSRPILDSAATGSSSYSTHVSLNVPTSGVPGTAVITSSDPSRFTISTQGTSTTTSAFTLTLENAAYAGDYLVVQRSVQSGTTAWSTPGSTGPSYLGTSSTLPSMFRSNATTPVADSYAAYAAATNTASTWDGTNVCGIQVNIASFKALGDLVGYPIFAQGTNITGVDILITAWNPTVLTTSRRRRARGVYDSRICKLERAVQMVEANNQRVLFPDSASSKCEEEECEAEVTPTIYKSPGRMPAKK